MASDDFVTKNTVEKDKFVTGYQRNSAKGKGAHDALPFFALTRDAALYERGAAEHGLNNWLKGAPFTRTLQSSIRHLFQYMMGDRSEDHLAACRWGCAAVMTYEELIKRGELPASLDDLPKYGKSVPAVGRSPYTNGEEDARKYARDGFAENPCECRMCKDARAWLANNPGVKP